MNRSELDGMKMAVPEGEVARGDDPEREKAAIFVRGWNSAIDCVKGLLKQISRETENGEAA